MDIQLTMKLKIEGISKAYEGSEVLKQVDFCVYEHEFLSLLGPSGCGKTTLLRILIGLLNPDSGRICKDGRDITNLPPDQRGMGIVFQNYALFENMSVLRNVEYALRFHDISKGEARERAQNMLEIVEIGRAHV